MQLNDPIAIYNAATNLEAQLIANHLNSHNISAFAVEDASLVGTYSLGLIPEIHKPQVFVDRTKADEARKLIEEYEDSNQQLQGEAENAPVDFCHACGERVTRGTPVCPGCERPLEWSDPEDEDSQSTTVMDTLKAWKKPIAALILFGPFLFMILIDIFMGIMHRLGR